MLPQPSPSAPSRRHRRKGVLQQPLASSPEFALSLYRAPPGGSLAAGRRRCQKVAALFALPDGVGLSAHRLSGLEHREEKSPSTQRNSLSTCGWKPAKAAVAYLKTIDLTRNGLAVPEADDLASIPSHSGLKRMVTRQSVATFSESDQSVDDFGRPSGTSPRLRAFTYW